MPGAEGDPASLIAAGVQHQVVDVVEIDRREDQPRRKNRVRR
jgi:hypothetical protein